MQLPAQCKLISKSGRVGLYNYTFECVKKGKRRRWSFSARSDRDAHAQMAIKYDDPNDMGRPAPVSGGGCLLPEELVLLDDHTMKPIGEIAPGDKLLMCKFGECHLRPVEPNEIIFHYTDTLVTLDFGEFEFNCSSTQSIITPFGPVRAGFLFPGASVTGLTRKLSFEASAYSSVSCDVRKLGNEKLVASVGTNEDLFFFASKALIGAGCHDPIREIKR